MGDDVDAAVERKGSTLSSTVRRRRRRKRQRSPSPSPPPLVIHTSKLKRQKKKNISKSTTLVTNDVVCTSTSTLKREKTRKKHQSKSGLRQWVFSSQQQDTPCFKDKLVIVSYNILGVQNAFKHRDLYPHVQPQFLNWDRRKTLICKELSYYRPSILCFQEVDRFSDIAKLLKEDGFEGIYKARTGVAHDGCAIFWKQDLFTLLHQESIEFREFDLRDNVAQICVLKMKSKSRNNANAEISFSRRLLVGNTHALFNPSRGDIKLGQIRLLVETTHRISREWGNIPVVIAGDLNSTPQSAIYQFLASSELNILLHDRKKMSGQIEGEARWGTCRSQTEFRKRWSREELQLAAGSERTTHLYHHLQLRSAYNGVPGSSSTRDRYGEPLATTYHSKFMGTVDYIWHSKEFHPVGVVETLPIDILRQTGGLPSEPAIAIVLGFIGCKMISDFFGYHVSTEVSLGFVASSLSGGVLLSLMKKSE